MKDLTIRLRNEPGALAAMGEALGRAGVSIEGGGGFVVGGEAIVHFLFEDGAAATAALQKAGIEVLAEREILSLRLNQQVPGQLGAAARAMADAGANIEVIYSDHQHKLILAVNDTTAGAGVVDRWKSGRLVDPKAREHHYRTVVTWTGNDGSGTSGYRAYRRDHEIGAPGKPAVPGSSDPHFRGDPGRWNPEEMLVASLSSCHQLWYLHLCSDAGVIVTEYCDRAEGVMSEQSDGAGQFSRVVLRPQVRIRAGSDPELAASLHDKAHAMCFIARSVAFPVDCEPTITVQTPED